MPLTSSLLTTKLYLPAARQELVRRPRLLAQLSEGLTGPLTLISAPAGFGKTTLISEWQTTEASRNLPLVWLALDDDDNDPARFFTYLIAAVATLQPGFGQTATALLQSPQPAPFKSILTSFINEVNLFSTPFGLVLDDYHVITRQAIHEALAFLLDYLPPLMHLVITTRTDPPLPLARLRARRQLAEIRGDDLRFTTDEAAAFLNQVMGLNLSPADVAVLEARTEGWVAGLQMAALSMQGRRDITFFINQFSGSHRYIIDYLMDEVLQQQPDDIQQFLLQTSILTRLYGSLCDAVLEKAEGGGVKDERENIFFIPHPSAFILEKLEQANLFVIPLDHERRWYRYHHLFAEALQHRLERLYPEQIPLLHRRASRWYEQHRLLAEAIQHALSVPDFEHAADLVEQVGQELLMRSEMSTLLRWLNILPEDVIQTRPQLCLFHAWTLILNGQITKAEQRLQEAGAQALDAAILGQTAAMRAFVTLLQGNIQLADELTRQAIELLPGGDPFLRGLTALTQGIPYFLNGDVETALQIFAGVADLSQQSGNIMLAILIQCQIAEAQIGQGRLHQARATYQRALDLATMPDGQQLPGASQAHIGLAVIWYEWNDLAAAMQHIAEGLRLGQQVGEIGAFDAYILQINLKQTQGDAAGALEALEQAGQLIEKFSPFMHRLLAIYRIRLWLRQGNLADAAREAFLEELNTAADMEHTYHFYELKQLTLVRVLTAQAAASVSVLPENPVKKALQILDALYPEAVKLGRGRSIIEIWLLRALAYQVERNFSQAMDALAQALTLAEAEGFVRLFVDEGALVAELLKRMNPLPGTGDEGGRQKEYIRKLLNAFEKNTDKLIDPKDEDLFHPSREALIPHPLVDPLSERELEILHLIAAGQSNEEIAATLVIAIGTVKKHIHNIYDKLGVHSRTQALVQAKTLNLLP